jgi:hypothetical protein
MVIVSGVVARREGGMGCDRADMGRSVLRPYTDRGLRSGFVARRAAVLANALVVEEK